MIMITLKHAACIAVLISSAPRTCALDAINRDAVLPEEQFRQIKPEPIAHRIDQRGGAPEDIMRPPSEPSALQETTSEFPKVSFEEITDKVSEEITCQPGTYVKMEEPRPSMGRYGGYGGKGGKGGPSRMCQYFAHDPSTAGCCDGGQERMCDFFSEGRLLSGGGSETYENLQRMLCREVRCRGRCSRVP